MSRYEPNVIEPKWQKHWADNKLYEVNNADLKANKSNKIYASPMLPYPSGAGLHTGHVRNFAIADAVARYYRQKGNFTLTTMAWDSFGLPAENYAIKTGTPPAVSTADNIAYFKQQLQRVGMSYDWSREFNTSDPSYYKWTQWVFGLMYKRDLAYKAEKAQWWCNKCNTVLADEQVDASGRCWRHDSPEDEKVTKKDVSQWFFKITQYADSILEATDELDWPEKIKTMQKNWIGRKTGINITYQIDNASKPADITCFTTRPDTNFGATFIVIAPEHSLAQAVANAEIAAQDGGSHAEEVAKYIKTALSKSELDRQTEGKAKTGAFTGLYAVNQLNSRRLPIWVADFVLSGFGTGAVVGVPAHDIRDFEFAEAFNLPIVRVVKGSDGDESEITQADQVQEEQGIMINSDFLNGLDIHDATSKIMDYLEQQKIGKRVINYRIRDWLISRQRYWGAPVPIIYCPDHGAVLVPESDLPVELPKVDNYVPDGKNSSVLAGVEDWVNAPCPTCGKMSKRETDTMDGYVCSTWYLHRYTDANNNQKPFDPQITNDWMPIDFYFGGDHAVAHLLYIRFFQRVLHDAGLASVVEPVKKLVYNGYINAEDGSKMSKSKGNTVDPMDIINSGYGADALRVFELFIAPYDQDTPWNSKGVAGCYRFLNRVWTLVQEYNDASSVSGSSNNTGQDSIKKAITQSNSSIKFFETQFPQLSFNTCIANLMSSVNDYYKYKISAPFKDYPAEWKQILESLLQLLAPFAPHIAEELWQQLGHSDSIHKNHWPTLDESTLKADFVKIVVQINGKLRAQIQVPNGADQHQAVDKALADENIQKHLGQQKPTKTIYVPGRIINFVV